MPSESGVSIGRAKLLEIVPKIEWGDSENDIFPEISQDIFCMYGDQGLGWYRISTDCHPTLNIEFMGASFETAMSYAKFLVEKE